MKPDPSSQSDPFPREKIPPEILEWARQTFDEDDFLTKVREIEATGGLQLEDFIAELEARALRCIGNIPCLGGCLPDACQTAI